MAHFGSVPHLQIKKIMKPILTLLICSITIINIACAQIDTQSVNTYKFPASRKVSLELPFARNIIVKTWDKQQVSFKTMMKADNEDIMDIYEMKVEEATDVLHIETGYKEQKKYKNFCGCDNDRGRGSWNCVCLEISYEIMLPKNTILSMETINGNIEIRGLESDISINSINGFVDIAYSTQAKADLTFSTINGEIYTDFDISKKGNLTKYSKSIKSSLNGGGAELELETINGDIYFRKQ